MFRLRTALIASALCAVSVLPIAGNSANAADDWNTDVESALRQAASQKRLAFIKFGAPWCAYCTKMDRTTFVDRDVAQILEQNYVRIYIDADKQPELVKALKIRGLPACLIVNPELMILERISGYQSAQKLLPILQRVAEENYSGPDGMMVPAQPAGTAAQPAVPQVPMQPAPTAVGFDDFIGGQPMPPAQANAASGNFRFGGNTIPSTSPAQTAQARPRQNPFENQNFFAAQDQADTNPWQTPQRPQAATASMSRSLSSQAAFDGNCLVSVREQRDLVPGSDDYVLKYRDHVIRFASSAQAEKFQQTPEEYWPVIDGHCAVTLVTENQTQSGQLEYAALFRGRIWLFASEEKMRAFVDAPAMFAAAAEKALRQ